MSKIASFKESYEDIKKYCDIWTKANVASYHSASNIKVNCGQVYFYATPSNSGIGHNLSFDAHLIDRYPSLEDFEKYCVDLVKVKMAAKKTDGDRIKELESIIVNSNDFKELNGLARKNGKVASLKIELDNTFVNFGAVGWPSNFASENAAGFLSRSGY
jgi:hypothetical protein